MTGTVRNSGAPKLFSHKSPTYVKFYTNFPKPISLSRPLPECRFASCSFNNAAYCCH